MPSGVKTRSIARFGRFWLGKSGDKQLIKQSLGLRRSFFFFLVLIYRATFTAALV